MKKYLCIFCLVVLIISCKKKNETSFYFWKTTYQLSATEKEYLSKLNVQKLYVRFFDVDIKNNEAVPVGEINVQEKNENQEIVPVVFITNETFTNLDKKKIEELAKHVQNEIQFVFTKISDKKIKEIQFDCDWTISTRNKYFYFLNQMKLLDPKMIFSATIRLHQIKDKDQTGIPPVNKGVLMYYATSNPLQVSEKNSILDNETAENYCKDLQNYPIALDVALPIYSWAIIENQLGEKRLLNGVRNDMLQDSTTYQSIKPNFYYVRKDHYLSGNYIYQDFTIKVEEITNDQLIRASDFLKKKIKNKEFNTIYFQLDSTNLNQHTIQDLQKISK